MYPRKSTCWVLLAPEQGKEIAKLSYDSQDKKTVSFGHALTHFLLQVRG